FCRWAESADYGRSRPMGSGSNGRHHRIRVGAPSRMAVSGFLRRARFTAVGTRTDSRRHAPADARFLPNAPSVRPNLRLGVYTFRRLTTRSRLARSSSAPSRGPLVSNRFNQQHRPRHRSPLVLQLPFRNAGFQLALLTFTTHGDGS